MATLRLAFAGTPPFAAAGLAALLDAGFEVGLVLSQPDRPAGRGLQPQPSAVKRLALERGLAVQTPPGLRPERAGASAPQVEQALALLAASRPDVLVVAAYGLLLPAAVLDMAAGLPAGSGRVGAINIHASVLPRWRGAAPIVRAIEAGDRSTGITIMQMDEGLDTGPILATREMPIDPQSSAGDLTARLAQLGGTLVVETLRALVAGTVQPRPQPAAGVTYAHKLAKHEAWVDWRLAPQAIVDRIRAFDPFPGACARLGPVTVKFWQAQAVARDAAGAPPGTVLASDAAGVVVACGGGAVRLTQLQRPGGRRLAAREFLAGMPIPAGARWSTASDASWDADRP